MKRIYLSLIFITILIFPTQTFADGPYLNIPPTNAFDKIVTSNGTVNAANFSMPVNIIGSGGITITGSNSSHTVIISNTASSTGKGTYNTTLANNVVINSAGHRINIINGSGNPVNVKNDPTRDQVNVTISSTGAGVASVSGTAGNITSTGGVNPVINLGYFAVTTNGANQTISKAINFTSGNTLRVSSSANRAGLNIGTGTTNPSTLSNGDMWVNSNIMKYQSGGNTLSVASVSLSQTYVGNNGHTGTNTVSGAGSFNFINTPNTLKVGSSGLIIRNPATTFANTIASYVIGANQTLTLPGGGTQSILGNNSKLMDLSDTGGQPCTDGWVLTWQASNSTWICKASSGTDTNTAQVVPADNGQSLISSKFNATETKLMTLRNQSAYLLWNHNSTSITPSFQFKVNSLSCPLNSAIISYNNSTGLLTCQAFGGGSVTSVSGTAGNITSTGGTTPVINLDSNAVIKNGANQTISKAINFTSGNTLRVTPSTNRAGLNIGTLTVNPAIMNNGDVWINSNIMKYQSSATTLSVASISLSQTYVGGNTFTGANKVTTGSFDFNTVANSLRLLSGAMTIRNPATTFGYSILGSAITHNRTLTLPLQTQNETIAVQPQINFTAQANRTGTTNTGPGVMLGPGIRITPTVTGRVEVDVGGYTTTSVAASGCSMVVRFGTGGDPLNGAAATGTKVGNDVVTTMAATTSRTPFSTSVQITGLAIGTPIWIQLGESAVTSGTCTVDNVNWAVKEL